MAILVAKIESKFILPGAPIGISGHSLTDRCSLCFHGRYILDRPSFSSFECNSVYDDEDDGGFIRGKTQLK